MSSATDQALLKISRGRIAMQEEFWNIGVERDQYSETGVH